MKRKYAKKYIIPSGPGRPFDIRWVNFKLGGAFAGKGNNKIIGDEQ